MKDYLYLKPVLKEWSEARNRESMSSAAQIAKLIDEFPSEAALEGVNLFFAKFWMTFFSVCFAISWSCWSRRYKHLCPQSRNQCKTQGIKISRARLENLSWSTKSCSWNVEIGCCFFSSAVQADSPEIRQKRLTIVQRRPTRNFRNLPWWQLANEI